MKYFNVLDKNGNLIFEGEFEHVSIFLSSKKTPIAKVLSNEKEKLYELNGLKIIDNEYDKISDLKKGETINYYIVNKKDKFGYIKEDGSKITEIIFSELTSYHNREFKNGLALVIEKGKKKFIKEDGTEFIEIETSCGNGYNNGLALIQKNRLYGYIDTKGNEITGYIYNDAFTFTEQGHGIVSKNRKWGIINYKGETILDFQYDKIDYLVSSPKNESSKKLLQVKIDNLFGFIDLDNGTYSKCDYKEIKYANEGFILVKAEKNWGVLNIKNEEIIPCIYDEIKISNSYIFCKKGKKIEVINTITKENIIYKCEKFYLFKDAYIIKNKENYLLFEFEGLNKFEIDVNIINEITSYYNGKIIGILNNKHGIIDIQGKILIEFTYDEIKLEFDDSNKPIYIVSKNDKKGVINEDYTFIIELQYENIILRHNFFMAKNNKLEELFDINGELINNIKYEYLTYWTPDNQLFWVGYYHKGMKLSKSTYMVEREKKNSKECRIIILSKSADDYLYVVAIGYAGGGVWGEIIAKISTIDNWNTSKGVFTNYIYDKNWKYEYNGEKCEEFNEAINEIDSEILKQLEEELFSKYVYYDDNDDEVADIPLLNKEFKATLKAKTFDSTRSTSIYKNLSKHWGLSYKW
jgi:hypothetical protein